ncbi:MAG TPA: acyltransferase, partial [Acidimicrobiia bacterium]
MATKGVGHVAVGERPASAPAGSRFPCFDGLRALAALGVFVFHASVIFRLQTSTFVPSEALRWLSPLGTTGVAIFFVISGFLLYRPFAVATFESRPSPRTSQFWKRRFFRIFPAYWVALAFAIWVFADTQVHTLSQGLTTFGLLQNYRAEYTLLGLGVAWTLVIELSFYLVLPLIAWCARAICDRLPTLTAKMTAQLAVIAALAAISLLLRYWYFFGATLHSGTRGAWLDLPQLRFWLPSYLDWFAYGMAMAVGSAWLSAGGRLAGIVAFLGRVPSLSWLLALECYWLVVQLRIAVFDNSPAASPTQEYLRFILYGLVGTFFVLPAVFGDQRRSATRAFLQTPVLVMLGVVSYGIYLWHFPIWLQLHAWFPSGMPMP